MPTYAEFLASKRRLHQGDGLASEGVVFSSTLYSWQAAIVRWALRKGRAAIFADCGLGKTFMQVEWARALGVPTLILAPLCVAEQTVTEAAKLGVTVRYVEDAAALAAYRRNKVSAQPAIVITNYERLDKFDPAEFGAVVLDESSILKSFDGTTRTKLIQAFQHTRYRLCCTATPSPNDIAELANHAEFLGLMTRAEFLATWFVHDDEGGRMKGHARQPFFRWLASWAVALRSPADIGYDDTGYQLPPLGIRDHVLGLEAAPEGMLFHDLTMKGIQGRMSARRGALDARVAAAADIVQAPGQWIVWCALNQESNALAEAIPGAVNVSGSDAYAVKRAAVLAFARGEIRVLITKAKILGFGLNFQHCHQMVFVGLSDSYETYYQCIQRCWRFGQRQPVDVRIILSEAEIGVVQNVRRKEASADDLSRALLREMRAFEREELCA